MPEHGTRRDGRSREVEQPRLIVVYERVSTTSQDIRRQAAQRDYAARDYPDREPLVIQDHGVSAFKTPVFDRPGGRKLCDLIEAGSVEAVYADALDRLHRGEELEWALFRAMCESGSTRLILNGRELGFDIGGRVEGYFKALLARQESVEKSHRVTSGKRRAAERGRPNGGPRKFGYTQSGGELTVVPHEAEALRRMRDRAVSGISFRAIAEELNADGVRTPRGKLWTEQAVSQRLSNRLLVGYVKHRGSWFPGNHEPIFTRREWDELKDALAARRRAPAKGRGRTPGRHLFGKGLLRCAHCGSTMASRRTSNEQGKVYERYVCSGRLFGSHPTCPMPSAPRDAIDSAALAYFSEAVFDHDATRARIAGQLRAAADEARTMHEHAERQVASAEEALARVRRDYFSGRIEAEDWREFQSDLEAERHAASAEAARLRSRLDQIVAEDAAADADRELGRHLADIRAATAGDADDTSTLEGLRAALRGVFDGFTLHSYAVPETDPAPVPADWVRSRLYFDPNLCVPGHGGWLLEPHPRRDLIIDSEKEIEFPQLRRVPLGARVRNVASPR